MRKKSGIMAIVIAAVLGMMFGGKIVDAIKGMMAKKA